VKVGEHGPFETDAQTLTAKSDISRQICVLGPVLSIIKLNRSRISATMVPLSSMWSEPQRMCFTLNSSSIRSESLIK